MKSSSKSSSTGSHVGKKTKVIWTKDLHGKFLEAIGKLGIDNAVPKKIVELMKVDGLTRDQVASHLQKYRILSKKIANANYCVQATLNPSLFESSMTSGTSWSNSLLMLNQEQINSPSYSGIRAVSPLILDTSNSYFPDLEAFDFSSTNKGYSLQKMTNNLDQQRNFIDATTNLSEVNLVKSSNSGFVQNLDGYFYDNDGCSSEVQIYNSFEMGSSSSVQYSSNSSFVQNTNGCESNHASRRELVEIGSLFDDDSNNYLENRLGEDDLKLNEVDIAYLASYVDDNNLSINLDPPIQDVKQNLVNNVSFYSEDNEQLISIDQHHSFDGNLAGFNPTFKTMDERFMEPIWSPQPCVDDMTIHSLILNSYVQS